MEGVRLSLYSEFTRSRRWSAIVKGGPNVVSTIFFSVFRPTKWASIVKVWACCRYLMPRVGLSIVKVWPRVAAPIVKVWGSPISFPLIYYALHLHIHLSLSFLPHVVATIVLDRGSPRTVWAGSSPTFASQIAPDQY